MSSVVFGGYSGMQVIAMGQGERGAGANDAAGVRRHAGQG